MRDVSRRLRCRGAISRAASSAADHGLGLIVGARGGREHEVQSAIGCLQRVVTAPRHRARGRRRPPSRALSRSASPARGFTSRSRDKPKFAMARAAAPIFSPSCGSTSTTIGAGARSSVWSCRSGAGHRMRSTRDLCAPSVKPAPKAALLRGLSNARSQSLPPPRGADAIAAAGFRSRSAPPFPTTLRKG